MKTTLLNSRREFLRRGFQTLSTIGAAGAFGQLGRMAAYAQAPGGSTDYKALVCIFLFGGNDANNMVIPAGQQTTYAQYSSIRGNLAIPFGSLLQVGTTAGPFGLHPSMTGLANIYNNSKKLAILANVGTLVAKTTRNQYLNNAVQVPVNLFSHADQQGEWQNAAPLGGPSAATGWCGRLADLIQPLYNTSNFPPSIGIAGNSLQLVGNVTQPTTITASGFTLDGSDGSAAANARNAALGNLITMSSGASLVQAANTTVKEAMQVAMLVNQANANNSGSITTPFPTTDIGQQLLQIAQLIQIRAALGMKRQIFFATLGGFDTHSNQLPQQVQLLQDLSDAMTAFYNCTGTDLGIQDKVVTFTESEFSRTFQPNGNAGTDHAWGSHALILGGGVVGGDMYGKFPTQVLNQGDDSGDRGNWIPTTGTDTYGATFAKWFGVNQSDLSTVFPNLPTLTASGLPATLGFMG